MIKQTHSYVVLELSTAAFQEIKSKLKKVPYGHCSLGEGKEELITLQEIAVKEIEEELSDDDLALVPSDIPKSPSMERLHQAVKVFTSEDIRSRAKSIYENECFGASIFWDDKEKQVEFIRNNLEIIIKER